jgi:uncharacterized repeat protein (TIGR03843 family)
VTGVDWVALLSSGAIEIEGRMPWSSNATFLVTVTSGEERARAIYKPGAGERPLWDYPSGLYLREVAAYELSFACGLGVVPETVLREDGPAGEGSLQRFVDADFSEHYFTLVEKPEHRAVLRRIAGFDLLANSGDRKGGHLLFEPPDRVLAIDNGLCCHVEAKLRTVMWDFIGEPIPDEVLAGCRAILANFPEPLYELLDDEECEALLSRAEALLSRPVFPHPSQDHRSYPWPPV